MAYRRLAPAHLICLDLAVVLDHENLAVFLAWRVSVTRREDSESRSCHRRLAPRRTRDRCVNMKEDEPPLTLPTQGFHTRQVRVFYITYLTPEVQRQRYFLSLGVYKQPGV
jgi:hypothetical protein